MKYPLKSVCLVDADF